MRCYYDKSYYYSCLNFILNHTDDQFHAEVKRYLSVIKKCSFDKRLYDRLTNGHLDEFNIVALQCNSVEPIIKYLKAYIL